MCKAKGENEYQQNQDSAAWSLSFLKTIQKTTFEGIVSKILRFAMSWIMGVVANEMLVSLAMAQTI